MTRLSRALFPAVFMAIGWSALGQDLVAVAPQSCKVEYEDARVRVERLKIAENETLPMHDRPARIVIPLTPGEARLTRPDGTSSISKTAAGNVAWSGPTKRSVTNVGPALENIVVGLKNVTEPAKPLAQAPNPRPAGYLEDRYHHWLFENQYVRVYDVRIPAGEASEFHTHALDSVSVILAGAELSTQRQGGEWVSVGKAEARAVEVGHEAKQPRTHRLRNDSKSEFRIVVVQFLQ